MKITACFKTPDAVDSAIREEFGPEPDFIEDDPHGEDREKAREVADKYVHWGESITVEFDTETGEARVVPKW